MKDFPKTNFFLYLNSKEKSALIIRRLVELIIRRQKVFLDRLEL